MSKELATKEQLNSQDVQVAPVVQLGTLQAFDPIQLLSSAEAIATPLAKVIQNRKLYTELRGRKHVHVEGWTTLAMMLGLIPREESVVESEGIYTATVELVRITDQTVLSKASAECGSPDEVDKYGKPIWASRPRYARRSMSITRATGKVCRMSLSWIMVMAGYDPTPAEEMIPDQTGDVNVYTMPSASSASSKTTKTSNKLVPIGEHSDLYTALIDKVIFLSLDNNNVKEYIRKWSGKNLGFEISSFNEMDEKSALHFLDNVLPRMAEAAEKRAREQTGSETALKQLNTDNEEVAALKFLITQQNTITDIDNIWKEISQDLANLQDADRKSVVDFWDMRKRMIEAGTKQGAVESDTVSEVLTTDERLYQETLNSFGGRDNP